MSKKELNIFKLLSQKPWEPSQAILDNEHDGKTLASSKAKLGVRTVMVVSTVIFSLFIVSYSDRMLVHDWKSLSEPWLLWINTGILIFTSFIFHKAKVYSDKNKFEKSKNTLLLVGFLSFAFITGQLLVWQHFINIGQYASTNPANAFYYLFTALHKRWPIRVNKSSKCILLPFYGNTRRTFIRRPILLGKGYNKVVYR